MDINHVIQSRRTVLDYKPDKIDRNTLLELFEIASYAPNHHMKEPWKIRLYEDEARSKFGEKIVDSYIRLGLLKTFDGNKLRKARISYNKFFKSVPHHALFYMEKEDGGGYVDDENYAAVCAFIQNFQLAAWNLGIGTMWTAKATLMDKIFIKDIGLNPVVHRLVAVVQIGYPNKIPKAKHRTLIKHAIEWVN